jgi:membrane protein
MALDSKIEKAISELLGLHPEKYPGALGHGIKIAQILVVAAKDFMADRCPLKASALSYTTILSLVPFLALVFAVLKGFSIQNRLEPLIVQQVAAGSEKAVAKIIQYINNTNVASLGIVGLLALVLTAVSLFDSIEEAFNDIWGVSETRSLYRKFSDYLSVALAAPMLMLAAASITTSLKSQAVVLWLLHVPYLGAFVFHGLGFIPYLSIWLALIFFYVFIPNTKVRFSSALIGGVLAGTLWQLAQWCYIHFQMGVTRYNAIYGALSLVPLVMVWIYTSWVVVLFGGEVAWAHQTLRSCRRGLRMAPDHAMQEYLALSLFRIIAAAFVAGRPARSAEEIAEELDVPTRIIQDLFHYFVDRGFLLEGGVDASSCLPARDIATLTVHEILTALRGYGGSGFTSMAADSAGIDAVVRRIEHGRAEALAGMTIRDLAMMPPVIDKTPKNSI